MFEVWTRWSLVYPYGSCFLKREKEVLFFLGYWVKPCLKLWIFDLEAVSEKNFFVLVEKRIVQFMEEKEIDVDRRTLGGFPCSSHFYRVRERKRDMTPCSLTNTLKSHPNIFFLHSLFHKSLTRFDSLIPLFKPCFLTRAPKKLDSMPIFPPTLLLPVILFTLLRDMTPTPPPNGDGVSIPFSLPSHDFIHTT